MYMGGIKHIREVCMNKIKKAMIILKIIGVAAAALPSAVSAASYPTVYKGVDYKKVYNYNYYVKKYPSIKKKYGSNKTAVLKDFAVNGIKAGRLGSKYCTTKAGKKAVRELYYKTLMKPAEAKVSRKLYVTKTSKKTNTIILVVDHRISVWYKKGYGVWERKVTGYCGYGRNGLSLDRTAGDGTTPIGSFPIIYAFGNDDDPGTPMKYRKTTPYSYLSIERDTYNQWVESRSYVRGEHLQSYGSVYKHALWIGYNVNPTTYGKGSAIFLHYKGKTWKTAGCVSVNPKVMMRIMKLARNGTQIIIVPKEKDIMKY